MFSSARTQSEQNRVDQDRERGAAYRNELRNRMLYASHVVDKLCNGKHKRKSEEKKEEHHVIAEDVKNKIQKKLETALSSTKKWQSAYKRLKECQSAYKRLKDFYGESMIFNILKDDRKSKKRLVDELSSLSEEARKGPLAGSSLAVAHALILAHYHVDVHGMSIEESINGILGYYKPPPATKSSNSPHPIESRMAYALDIVRRVCQEGYTIGRNNFIVQLEHLIYQRKANEVECQLAVDQLRRIIKAQSTTFFETDEGKREEAKKRLLDELSTLKTESSTPRFSFFAVAYALTFAHYDADAFESPLEDCINGILEFYEAPPATQSSNFATLRHAAQTPRSSSTQRLGVDASIRRSNSSPQLGAESHPAQISPSNSSTPQLGADPYAPHGIEVRMVYALDVVSRVCHGGCYRTSCASLLLEEHRLFDLFDRQFIVDLRHLLDATESISPEECQLAVDQLRRIIKAQSTTFFETDEGKREEARKSLLDELSTLKTELSEAHGRDWRFSLIAVAHALTFAHGVDVSEGPLEDSINGILEFYEAPTQSSQISRSLTELSRRPKSQKRKVRRKKHRGGLRQHMKRRRSRRRNSKQAAK